MSDRQTLNEEQRELKRAMIVVAVLELLGVAAALAAWALRN